MRGELEREPLEKQMKAELTEIKKVMESDIEYLQKLGPRTQKMIQAINNFAIVESGSDKNGNRKAILSRNKPFHLRERNIQISKSNSKDVLPRLKSSFSQLNTIPSQNHPVQITMVPAWPFSFN